MSKRESDLSIARFDFGYLWDDACLHRELCYS